MKYRVKLTESVYVQLHLYDKVSAFLQWQLDNNVYEIRGMTFGGPTGLVEAIFSNDDAMRICAWLVENGIGSDSLYSEENNEEDQA